MKYDVTEGSGVGGVGGLEFTVAAGHDLRDPAPGPSAPMTPLGKLFASVVGGTGKAKLPS